MRTTKRGIMGLGLRGLWRNYLDAMTLAIHHTMMDDEDEAMFYLAVQRLSLDAYFDRIEREVMGV